MAKTQPTPEEIEAARQMVAEADAAAAAAAKAAVRESIQPFIAAGIGVPNVGTDPLQKAAEFLKANMALAEGIQPGFGNTAYQAGNIMLVVLDNIRTQAAMNAA